MGKTRFASVTTAILLGLGPTNIGTALATGSVPLQALSSSCSKRVHPSTMAALVHFESGGNPYAINVNGGYRLPRQPVTKREAVATAKWLSERGYNYDSGLGQVNSKNISKLGVTNEQSFDPCVNLRISSDILYSCYTLAPASSEGGQSALLRALSCYNTGNTRKGFQNGYVRKVVDLAKASGKQELMVPALLADDKAVPVEPKIVLPDAEPHTPKAKKRDSGTPDAFGETGRGTPDAFEGDTESQSSKSDKLPAPSQANEESKQGKLNAEEGVSRSSATTDEYNKRGENPESSDL